MVRLLLIIACILAPLSAMGQQGLIDSLLLRSQNEKGLERAKILVDLSNAAVYTTTADALNYAEEAFAIAQQERNDSVQYAAMKAMGYANAYLGNFDKSLQNMRDGLNYYTAIKDSVKIAEAISDIAYLLQATTNEHEEIMKLNLQALNIRETLNDKKGIAYSLNNIGAYLWDWEKEEEALVYFKRAAPIFQELDLTGECAQVNSNLGAYYISVEQYDTASYYLKIALDAFSAIEHRLGQAEVLSHLSEIALNSDKKDEARVLLYEAREWQEIAGDKEGLVGTLHNIAFILLGENQIEEAELLALEAEQLVLEMGLDNKLPLIYELLAECAEKQNDYERAYVYLSQGKVLQDSLFNVEKHEQIEKLHTKYKTNRKEAENMELLLKTKSQELLLKRNRLVLLGTAVLTLFIVAFLWLFYRNSRTQEQMKTLISEQRLLRSQMNPHFIFNAISAIQNYVLNHSQKEGVRYLSKFASLFRQTLDSSQLEKITLTKEITMLNNYFALQRLRYSDRFDFHIGIDPNIDKDNTFIPPMLNQPFIENAIEHGLKQLKMQGVINLSYRLISDCIWVEIEDNGVGINVSKANKKECHLSFAIEANHQRLRVIHKKAKTKLVFNIFDKSSLDTKEHGTIVRYTIPYIKEF